MAHARKSAAPSPMNSSLNCSAATPFSPTRSFSFAENRRPAVEAGRGGNYAGISVRPVVAVACKGAYRTAIKHEKRAIASAGRMAAISG